MSQIFTKTLTIQVWRPEFERPGRHFVYTTRYVYFFASLLDQLDDRASLDQLLRRVRKKQGDFINHTKLWEDICLTYAKMIRRAAQINEGHEESIFKPIGWEEFSTKTARLEGLAELALESQPLLELIRDALELKKLNNNFMKVTMFEDLIADLYSRVYELNTPLLVEQANEENKEKMKVDHLLMAGEAAADGNIPAVSLPASDTPAPRGRTKGIARRDIQKRADTIVTLKLAPRTAASKAVTADNEQSTPARRGSNSAATSGPAATPQGAGKHPSMAGEGRSEQPGDETEMSDMDESKLESTSSLRKSIFFPNLQKGEPGDAETEEDAGSGEEGAEEGDDEEDDGANDNDGEGDAGATETGGEENQDIDDDGDDGDDEIQEGDGEDTMIEESKLYDEEDQNDEGDNGDNETVNATDGKESIVPTPSEDTEQPEAMDTTPA